jgi:hypothetical protein
MLQVSQTGEQAQVLLGTHFLYRESCYSFHSVWHNLVTHVRALKFKMDICDLCVLILVNWIFKCFYVSLSNTINKYDSHMHMSSPYLT